MTDIIFESFINLFQSVVVTVFLIISLGCKDKYNKKCVSAAGILITFIYLTVSNHLVFFESVGIYVYMAYSLMFSFVILSGSVIEKIFYNVMMICCLVGSCIPITPVEATSTLSASTFIVSAAALAVSLQ